MSNNARIGRRPSPLITIWSTSHLGQCWCGTTCTWENRDIEQTQDRTPSTSGNATVGLRDYLERCPRRTQPVSDKARRDDARIGQQPYSAMIISGEAHVENRLRQILPRLDTPQLG